MQNVINRIVYKGKRIEDSDVAINDMLDTAVEVLMDNRSRHIIKDFDRILYNYELVSGKLKFSKEDEHKEAFDYGRMYAIAVLLKKLGEMQEEREYLDEIKYRSKYLEKALEIVEEKGNVSSKELSECLGMKNRSDISNFMNRVEKYKLFRNVKVGRSKYYSLAANGIKYVEYLKTTNNYSIRTDNSEFILSLLDNIADEIKEDVPEAFSILVKTNRDAPNNTIFGSRLLKRKIEGVIESHNEKVVSYYYKKLIAFNSTDYEIELRNNCFLEDYDLKEY